MQSFSVTAPRLLTEVLRYEVHPNYTREQETFASAGPDPEDAVDIEIGTVLGKVTANGKVVPLAPAAVDGSQNAYGVALQKFTVLSVDLPGLALVRGPSITVAPKLIWPAGIAAPQQAAALAALATKGILARDD